ncbi:MAG TPA: aa3-type cytochrome c oxidase subunit IV [Devosia sp.]|jgi:hypothetical protein|nr:aa3-type cytochrome c oxidase subunit IV [Devosia sp.]
MAKKTATPAPAPQQESVMDYVQHQVTYDGFIGWVKWSVFGMAVLMVLLYVLINP